MKNHEAEQQEEMDDTPRWREALRAVENGECAAQLEIADVELRTSMIRNVAAAIQAAEAAERERCAQAVCGRCAKGMPLTPNLQHFHACETPETCAAPEDHIHFDGRIGYETGCEAEPIYRLPAPPSTPEAD